MEVRHGSEEIGDGERNSFGLQPDKPDDRPRRLHRRALPGA